MSRQQSISNRFTELCGLKYGEDKTLVLNSVPLLSVEVKAAIVHAVGQVEITQVYKNTTKNPLETVYYFPLDCCGGVTLFQAEFDDGIIVKGIVKTIEEAEEDYRKAVKNQSTAFLGQYMKPDIFKIKVGCLKPGIHVKVVIGYVTEVKNYQGTSSMRFVLPTTITPRYTPHGHPGISDGGTNRMEFSSESHNVPLSINVAVSMRDEIELVTSPTHSIISQECEDAPQKNWNKWIVSLKGTTTEMDRDFVLLITPKDVCKPRLYYSIDADGCAVAMVHLIPSFKLKEAKSEFVVIIDRSGSMNGLSIQLAKKALLLFLHSLPSDCFFNIVGFGTFYKCLFGEGSKRYDEDTLGTAKTYAEGLEADYGGTEIMNPLGKVLSSPLIPKYDRQVFVITDGAVSNPEEVIGLVKRYSKEARVFSLGIGSSSSAHLVRGIALAGGGTSVFVESDENIQKQTLSQLKNAMQPGLTNVCVKWNYGLDESVEDSQANAEVEINKEKTLFGYNKPVTNPLGKCEQQRSPKCFQAPRRITQVFDGEQLVVFGIFLKDEIPLGVSISGDSPDGPLSLELELSDENYVEVASMFIKLAGIKVIQELEFEETDILSEIERPVGHSVKKDICEIALKYGIASKYTSFVGVREDVKGDKKDMLMETLVIPSMAPHGLLVGSSNRRNSSSSVRCSLSRITSGPEDLSADYVGSLDSVDTDESPHSQRRLSSPNKPSIYFPYMCKKISVSSTARDDRQGNRGKNVSSVYDIVCRRIGSTSGGRNNVGACGGFGAGGMDILHRLVEFQNYSGSYDLSMELCTLIRVKYEEMMEAALSNGWDTGALATSLAIVYFKEVLKNLKDYWDLVVKKAEKWLVMTYSQDEVKNLEALAMSTVKVSV